MNHLYNLLSGLLLGLSVLCVAAPSTQAQTANLRVSAQLDCARGQYIATLQIRASDATSFSIGTSSIFLTYDPSSLTFVGYESLMFDNNTLCNGQTLWDAHSFDGSNPGLFNLTMALNSSSISCPLITNTDWVSIGTLTFGILDSNGNPSLLFDPSLSSFNAVPDNDGLAQIQAGQYTGINQAGALRCILPCSLVASATVGPCLPATNTYVVTGSVSATNATGSQSLTLSTGSASTVVTLTGNGPASYTLTGLPSDGLVKTLTVVSSASVCGTTSLTYSAPQSCSVSCPAPITVCQGSTYAIQLNAPAGQTTYQWYRNGQLVAGDTASHFTATQAGSYSVVVNGDGGCVGGSCCPFVIVEMAGVPDISVATAAPGCSGGTPLANGRLILTGLGNFSADQYTYQYVLGNSFSTATTQPSTAASIPANGIILTTLTGGETVSVRVFNTTTGCYQDRTGLVPVPTCDCPPAVCVPILTERLK